ncbi:alanine--tRNA ligase [Blattabacterium cuenoti]|uniref:alanine--tRNA ligase n=1 Tax=Blattabacterium cuenoti TaxID=1653831 RepID=UPI00163CB4CA|nr:alanine--tRNA ligase [Blattabacterium cuenoti]
MKYKLIKDTFLSFFKKKKHKIIPSYPIYLRNDPSLFFVNAGMNPFKDYFLGHVKPKYTRVANIQKCLRITGKHNDLENVGHDNYHHTMFEMLGNWSFGDYSRKETIEWAWELLIKVYNIPNQNIYVSIFIGDKKDKLYMDKESFKYWKTLINENHILFFGKKENFWEMGLTGPCGPCSEIHIDLRNEKEKKILPGRCLINKKHPQVIEIWNLVFIEFTRKSDGTLEKLSTKHVDTGMGLERLCMVLQGKISSYETDIFYPIIKDIKDYLGKIYNKGDIYQNMSIQIIADHLRAIVFSISDGKLPSNNGAGYVIRKILRRAVIYSTRFLKEPFIYKFVDSLVREMKSFFPELDKKKRYIQDIIQEEELSFFNVIEKGSKKIQHIITNYKEKNDKIIDGKKIFKLYDTYGFPMKLSKMLVEKNNLFIDEKSFQKKLLEQQERSKKENNSIIKKDWIKAHNNFHDNQNFENFVGYDFTECNVFILKYREVENLFKKIHYYELVFSKTPFYPEGGGQLGDTGIIKNKIEIIDVFDTKIENFIIIHCVKKLPLDVFSSFKAIVNQNRRKKIEKNHTSTHLLHFALKQILGNHVQQKGSYVGDDYLRFDYSHYKKITIHELNQIENLVQKLIFDDLLLEVKIFNSLQEIEKNFSFNEILEDKYKQNVRVVTFGESSELCIGTHVKHTGLIQVFDILSESSISHGIRRIKAITSETAIQHLKSIRDQYQSIKKMMKYPESPIKSFSILKNSNEKLKQKISKIHLQKIKILKKEFSLKAIDIDSIKYICEIDPCQEQKINIMKKIVLDLRHEISNLFMIVGFVENEKVIIFISISDYVIKNKNVHAYKIICEMASHINGKCWGNSYFSTAMGTKKNGLNSVLKDALGYQNHLRKNKL